MCGYKYIQAPVFYTHFIWITDWRRKQKTASLTVELFSLRDEWMPGENHNSTTIFKNNFDKLPYFDKIYVVITHSVNFLVLILTLRKFVIICDMKKNPFPERKNFQAHSFSSAHMTKIKGAVHYCAKSRNPQLYGLHKLFL